jgi:hypothetical protein
MAKDSFKPTQFKDPITGKKQDKTGGGPSRDISAQIEKAQRQSSNPSR